MTQRNPIDALEPRTLWCAEEALPPPADAAAFGFPPATVSATADNPAPGPGLPTRPTLAWTTGLKRVLYVRVTFADRPAHRPQTYDDARRSMAFADAFVRANSFGATSFRATITDVLVLPRPESFYLTAGAERLRADALAGAKAARAHWDAKNYDLDLVRYDGGPAADGGRALGFARTNGRGAWLRTDEPAAAVHELGHNLGLNHANLWEPADGDAPAGPGRNVEYGNPFSLMGSGGAAGRAGHFSAYEKRFLGWLPDAAVATADRSGRYTLRPADTGRLPAPGEYAALRVRKDGLRDYWLSPRAAPFWAATPSLGGLEVGWGAWSRDAEAHSALGSHLLDMTPGPWEDRYDYGLPLGRTFTDESAGVHVTPLRRHADGAVEVAVSFDRDRPAANLHDPGAPEIGAAGLEPGTAADDAALPLPVYTVAAGRSVSLTASSRDADGDALAYAWDFGAAAAGGATGPGGMTSGADPAAAPPAEVRYDAPGVYRARVTVSDLRGRTSSSSVLVRVTAGGGGADARNVVTGRATDALGAALPNVRVGDATRWAYTDADGAYALAGLDAADRGLSASRPGGWSFEPVAFDNPVRPGPATRGIDFRGTPAPYHITGAVVTLGGHTVKDVLVSDGTHSALTDGLGRYALPAANGVYDLTFHKPGFPVADARGVVVDYGDAFVRSVAEVTGVGGVVRGVSAGVTVTVSYDGPTGEEVIGGSYRFAEVPRGAWAFTATGRFRDGRVVHFVPDGWTNPVTVDGAEGPLDFKPAPAGAFSVGGRVTTGDEAVPGATVKVVDKRNGDAVVATVPTDDAGRYLIHGLPAGAYAVSARKPGLELAPLGRRFVLASDRGAVDFRVFKPPPDLPPTLARPVVAGPARVGGVSTWLSADAVDDHDAARLAYTWTVVSAPAGANVSFLRDGSNAARRTLATFDRAGEYEIGVTVEDRRGGRTTGVTTVTVVPVLSGVRLDSAYAAVAPGSGRQFRAQALDQFGRPVPGAIAVAWQVVGGIGTVSADGVFSAAGFGRGSLVARASDGATGVEAAGSATIDVAAVVGAPAASAAPSVAERVRPQRAREAVEVLG